ncbi:extracellular solute-binding protein [Mesobacillus selenatarsenatis]|uniref:Xylose ABC transporter, substrate-binding component n=1 Tax=Mesobacillus selenatarsenatis (strain DSM 18680 / JCM 14380 / FERM P-15431 / SF-1) TaxID=1321606 RepID=A0A0A8XDN2_MESS1|nr:extracellular solute-binding protein [Mesobacillus selenatarsenatis]GAM16266.1 xylose ABC transporter, substrate-binding component [Mesobacillus selenatarsenatis SF-1]
MKKFKVLMALVMAVVVSLLAACGDEKTSSEGESSKESGEKVTLNLWHFDPGTREQVYLKAIERFEKEHPNVTVKPLLIPNDKYKQRLVVAMAGKNAPDVFATWGGGYLQEFADSGKLVDLTNEDIDYSRFVDVALKNSTYDDKVYGLPLGIATYQFFYNKEIFKNNGIEVPKTYNEFLAAAETLKKADVYPIALANQPQWPGAFYLMYLADRIGGEEVFQKAYNRDGGSFADEAYVKAGEMIQDLVDRDAFNPGFNGLPYDAGSARQMMYTNKAAMMLMTSGFVNNVRDEFPEFEDKMGVFQFPALEDGKGDPTNISAGVSPVWSISKSSKQQELALELINELTSVETGTDYADMSGTPVAIKGVEPKDEYVKTFTNWINDANSIQFPYDQTLSPELAQLHKETTFKLFGKTMTPQEAADAMEKKAAELEKK